MPSPSKKKKKKKNDASKTKPKAQTPAAPNRMEETEDGPEDFEEKCQELATLLRKSKCCMVYTGAGISTAASIPDYRGPKGLWTLAGNGETHRLRGCNPVDADPTLSHMALKELYRRGVVQHILSQNCDGFHLRSGLPQKSLSEIHGNMHIEVCTGCDPTRQYIRSYDVTPQTRYRRHKTERRCDKCNNQLQDTIVHFGEMGKYPWPLNWKGALDILRNRNCDLILCVGSSLKILQKYEFLWCLEKPAKERPKLVVVNLQWTPKDRSALKINGKCDAVMKRIMEILNYPIPDYCRKCDPVLSQKRRSSRNNELMSAIKQCTCTEEELIVSRAEASERVTLSEAEDDLPLSAFRRQNSSNSSEAGAPETTFPGWWMAGLLACSKRKISSSQTPSEAGSSISSSSSSTNELVKRGRGRPRKKLKKSRIVPSRLASQLSSAAMKDSLNNSSTTNRSRQREQDNDNEESSSNESASLDRASEDPANAGESSSASSVAEASTSNPESDHIYSLRISPSSQSSDRCSLYIRRQSSHSKPILDEDSIPLSQLKSSFINNGQTKPAVNTKPENNSAESMIKEPKLDSIHAEHTDSNNASVPDTSMSNSFGSRTVSRVKDICNDHSDTKEEHSCSDQQDDSTCVDYSKIGQPSIVKDESSDTKISDRTLNEIPVSYGENTTIVSSPTKDKPTATIHNQYVSYIASNSIISSSD